MNEPTPETLTQRLDRLEGKNRRLKWLVILMLFGIVALWLSGQAKWGKAGRYQLVSQFGSHTLHRLDTATGGVQALEFVRHRNSYEPMGYWPHEEEEKAK